MSNTITKKFIFIGPDFKLSVDLEVTGSSGKSPTITPTKISTEDNLGPDCFLEDGTMTEVDNIITITTNSKVRHLELFALMNRV